MNAGIMAAERQTTLEQIERDVRALAKLNNFDPPELVTTGRDPRVTELRLLQSLGGVLHKLASAERKEAKEEKAAAEELTKAEKGVPTSREQASAWQKPTPVNKPPVNRERR